MNFFAVLVVAATALLTVFATTCVTAAPASCTDNRWLAPNGTCVTCVFDEYPGTGGCIKYASLNDKVLADRSGAALDSGNTAFVLIGAGSVALMSPALALFYAAMSPPGSVMNAMLMTLITMSVISVLWVLAGYSLAFSPSGNSFIGDFSWGAWTGVGSHPSAVYGGNIPHQAFAVFQMMFAAITPCLISGAVVGRMTLMSFILFSCLWMVLVYCPIIYSVWALKLDGGGKTVPAGWLGQLGLIDAAGGAPIHTAAGFAAVSASLIVGPRLIKFKTTAPNSGNLLTGTLLLLFGWYSFNGASALAAGKVAANAVANTHVAASTAIVVWFINETLHAGKSTLVGAATACVIGLVSVTPCAFVVNPASAIGVGGLASLCCYWINVFKTQVIVNGGYLDLDDTLDVFLCHGCGGFIGLLLAGIFADEDNAAGVAGVLNGKWMILGVQLLGAVFAASYSGAVSALILLALKHTIGIRISAEEEVVGIDNAHGGGGRDLSLAPKDDTRPFCVFFTDIQMSTLLFTKDEALMAAMLDLHDKILADVCAKHGIFVVKKIGDSFFCCSHDIVAAVRCVIEIQQALFDSTRWNAPALNSWYSHWISRLSKGGTQADDFLTASNTARRTSATTVPPVDALTSDSAAKYSDAAVWNGLRVRIGLHFGEGTISFDQQIRSYDYTGLAVSTCARVADAAHGGQTLLTLYAWETAVQLDPTLTDSVDAKNMGDIPLRGVRGLTNVVQVLPVNLAARRFPPLRVGYASSKRSNASESRGLARAQRNDESADISAGDVVWHDTISSKSSQELGVIKKNVESCDTSLSRLPSSHVLLSAVSTPIASEN